VPNSSAFVDASSGLDYGSCSATSFSPALPIFGAGHVDTFTNCIPKTDMVQALLQVVFAQERTALIDLERAKLRICAC
jgi:hypothetical protein